MKNLVSHCFVFDCFLPFLLILLNIEKKSKKTKQLEKLKLGNLLKGKIIVQISE